MNANDPTSPEAANGADPAAVADPVSSSPPAPAPAADLEARHAELSDAYLRAKAEAENTRRRAEEEMAKARKFAVESFAESLLPVRDSLEAALAADNATFDTLRQGVELTLKQLDAALAKSNIKEINPIGEKFDPHKHQAMTTVESDRPANTVVHVLQKGYLLNDRVLRPALVTVSKPKA